VKPIGLPAKRRWLLVLALAVPIAALALTLWVAKVGAPLPLDIALARDVQRVTPFAPTEDVVNWIGDRTQRVLLLLCLIVLVRAALWLRTRGDMQRLAEFAAATFVAIPLDLGSSILKNIVESPRPTASAGLTIEHRIPSYGFPSGHVYGDVLALGLAAIYAPLWLPKPLVPFGRAALLLTIVLSGAARIYVGAHWPSDTLGGYLWGATALGLALMAGHLARTSVERRLRPAEADAQSGPTPRH
jgi:membrane-associated phospholipid phosphatase